MKKFYSLLLGIFLASNLLLGFSNVPDAKAVATRVYLTSGSSWTVPSDWNSANNTIEVIGGGGGGSCANNGFHFFAQAGGGAYSKISNQTLTIGSSIPYSVGGGGGATGINVGASSGGDTWFGNASYASAYVGAKGAVAGAWSATPGTGGQASGGIGTVKYSGGSGQISVAGFASGGAAGPHGDGQNSSGNHGGGAGDAGYGGGGGSLGVGGGNGTEWDSTHGSGGGGGTGGTAGGYGGGGGGGDCYSYSSRAGYQGIIVISYEPISGPATIKTINGLTVSTGIKTKNGVTPATTKTYQNNN